MDLRNRENESEESVESILMNQSELMKAFLVGIVKVLSQKVNFFLCLSPRGEILLFKD